MDYFADNRSENRSPKYRERAQRPSDNTPITQLDRNGRCVEKTDTKKLLGQLVVAVVNVFLRECVYDIHCFSDEIQMIRQGGARRDDREALFAQGLFVLMKRNEVILD
jgi:hypothetical protein